MHKDIKIRLLLPGQRKGIQKEFKNFLKSNEIHRYVYMNHKTRAEAERFCNDHQMQLVGFESRTENEEVVKLMEENGKTFKKINSHITYSNSLLCNATSIPELEGFWTSGVDKQLNGKWVWEQSTFPFSSPVKFFEWCRENPDNFDGNDFYILVKNQPDGINCWEDTPGDARWPAICQPTVSVKNLKNNLIKLSSQLQG